MGTSGVSVFRVGGRWDEIRDNLMDLMIRPDVCCGGSVGWVPFDGRHDQVEVT